MENSNGYWKIENKRIRPNLSSCNLFYQNRLRFYPFKDTRFGSEKHALFIFP